MEFVITSAGVILPLIFMIVFTSQLLWVWNSAIEWTRDGARYAATHCWQGGSDNVLTYMRAHVPGNIDQDQFKSGATDITVTYYSRNADSGALDTFACDGGECSAECVPDAVRVSITSYSYRNFMSYLGLPPVAIPEFATALPMESAGCDPDTGTCLP